MDRDTIHDKTQLSLCPMTNCNGLRASDSEPSTTSMQAVPVSPSRWPEQVTFELTCTSSDVTTTKRWTLPLPWLFRPDAAAICAAFVDSAISDVSGLVE